MRKNNFNLRFSVVCMMTVMVAFCRMIPHIPNFSPIGAVCLFGAAYFPRKWQAYLVPIAATWIGDLYLDNIVFRSSFGNGFLWFYPGWYWQYGSYALIILAGELLFRKVNVFRIGIGALGASVIFFIISNFGVWISGGIYPKSIYGLTTCYTMAIPFFKNTIIGNILYSALLFGLFSLAEKRLPALKNSLS